MEISLRRNEAKYLLIFAVISTMIGCASFNRMASTSCGSSASHYFLQRRYCPEEVRPTTWSNQATMSLRCPSSLSLSSLVSWERISLITRKHMCCGSSILQGQNCTGGVSRGSASGSRFPQAISENIGLSSLALGFINGDTLMPSN
ncbi:hypothetical protein BDV19DRAFT_354271 [Aspergillus venezuelensis]